MKMDFEIGWRLINQPYDERTSCMPRLNRIRDSTLLQQHAFVRHFHVASIYVILFGFLRQIV